MEESWRRKWKVVRKWNVIVWKGILFLFSVFFFPTTMLAACVFVTRDTVRHPRRFLFGKFVRKPNCSWSDAFVNRGLTIYIYISPYWYIFVYWRNIIHYTNVICSACRPRNSPQILLWPPFPKTLDIPWYRPTVSDYACSWGLRLTATQRCWRSCRRGWRSTDKVSVQVLLHRENKNRNLGVS